MTIKIFLLKNEQNSYAKRLAPELAHLFAAYLPEGNGVLEYASVRDAAEEISRAFADSHVILFLAEPAKYAETKSALASAIGLQLHLDAALLEKACAAQQTTADANSEFALKHAYLPDNARPVACEDGLYTGFAVSSGNQTVLLAPLERGRTELLLAHSVIPLLSATYMVRADMETLK
ncbi:MAG: hypothetical protein IJK98_00820, partial [Clostridia bacterium]|nr:hypothetical protein [Clostridia bacterium]